LIPLIPEKLGYACLGVGVGVRSNQDFHDRAYRFQRQFVLDVIACAKGAAIAEPIVRAVAASEEITSDAGKEALTEQVVAAIGAPRDLNGNQSVALAQKTTNSEVLVWTAPGGIDVPE
jgi:hypothetical protein